MWSNLLNKILTQLLLVSFLILSTEIEAADNTYYLVIENHVFKPSVIEIPPNKKVKLVIHNKDKLPEEFDSFDLNREKVIFAGKKSTIYIGPLPAGEYYFIGEYHPVSAQGKVLIKELKNAD
ncbi:cupredoxin domain-containing protein [Thalassotalea profundi]|uniref:EfeO-type cupredoxin-like domain-containing protein n=1 Tax=Thalassotalea profundi TaxID=2036687 RepID=A0ABQ3IEG2_9GAMM|nr:cupredoxin domain-containing protein [Thalassotalea profundi]GHE77302.1 hypothetical protein GCM10011501_00980 [Thalassotalea profundi]